MMWPMCEHEQEQLLHGWRLQYPGSPQKLPSTVNYLTVLQGFYRRHQNDTILSVKFLVVHLSKDGKRGNTEPM